MNAPIERANDVYGHRTSRATRADLSAAGAAVYGFSITTVILLTLHLIVA